MRRVRVLLHLWMWVLLQLLRSVHRVHRTMLLLLHELPLPPPLLARRTRGSSRRAHVTRRARRAMGLELAEVVLVAILLLLLELL